MKKCEMSIYKIYVLHEALFFEELSIVVEQLLNRIIVFRTIVRKQ